MVRRRAVSDGGLRQALVPLLRALIAIVLMLIVFSAGFCVIFHLAIGQAIYTTVVTMTTLGDAGFMVHGPLQETWVALTTIAGVAGGIAAIASITSFGWRDYFRRTREERAVRRLRHHIIVAGGGRVGRRAATEMLAAHQEVIVLERDPKVFEELQAAGIACLSGDATDLELLERAGLGQAEGLIAALSDDAANVYTVMLARDARPDMPIAARASDMRSAEMLKRAGAQRVVLPEVSAGHSLANFISRPTVLEMIEDGSVEEVRLGTNAPAVGRTLGDIAASGFSGTVAAIKRQGTFLSTITRETVVETGDILLLVGDPERLQRELDRITG